MKEVAAEEKRKKFEEAREERNRETQMQAKQKADEIARVQVIYFCILNYRKRT